MQFKIYRIHKLFYFLLTGIISHFQDSSVGSSLEAFGDGLNGSPDINPDDAMVRSDELPGYMDLWLYTIDKEAIDAENADNSGFACINSFNFSDFI